MSQASSKRVRVKLDADMPTVNPLKEETAREHLKTQHVGDSNREMLLHTSHELDFHCASKSASSLTDPCKVAYLSIFVLFSRLKTVA